MTKRITGWLAAGIVAALGVTAVVQAQQGPPRERGDAAIQDGWKGPRGSRGEPFGGHLAALRGLDLSPDQRQQVRTIVQQHSNDFRAIAERMRTASRAVDEAVTAAAVDESLIRQRVTERAAVEADAAVLRARVHSQIWQVLTPDQQQKAESLKAERQKRMEERRQRMQQRLQRRQQNPAQ